MRQFRSKVRLLLVFALLMFAVVGTASAEAADHTQQPIAWAPCPENAAVECATLTLPVDWSKPGGETFGLALARRVATDPSARIGPLLINPGGPGGSGVNFAINSNRYFSPDILARFDIIGFDPRGVVRSHPVVCSEAALNAPGWTLVPKNQAQFDALVAYNKALGEDCRKQTGPLFDHIDSVDVARDIEAIRRALGERKINWYGGSYGTLIGQMYAELYPSRIRSMVLDSNMDHSLGTTGFTLTETIASEDGFNEFVAWCDRNAACVLHGQDVEQVWRDLLARADRGEVTDPENGEQLGADQIIDGMIGELYGPSWAGLAEAIAALSAGTPSGGVEMDFDLRYTSAVAVAGSGGSAAEPVLVRYPFSVFCAEWSLPVRNQAAFDRIVRQNLRIAPNTRYSTLGLSGVTSCLGWPAKVTNPQHRLKVSGTPTLLMTNALHDPATGYVWAVDAARQLGRSTVLVTYEGWGHGVYRRSDCTREVNDAYLIDLTVPARGTRCPGVEPAVTAASRTSQPPSLTGPWQ